MASRLPQWPPARAVLNGRLVLPKPRFIRRLKATLGLALAFIASALVAAPALAGDALQPPASEIDEDFLFQGEYAGCIAQSPGCPQWTGLQIVALGEGRFSAVEFPGGLPGNGGGTERQLSLSGLRAGDCLRLTSDTRRMTARNGVVLVHDAFGALLGRLEKYHRLGQTLRQQPPPGAVVLFDGTHTDRFTNAILSRDRALNAGAETKDSFGDLSLHVEFRVPYAPPARDQSRGNSGVYLRGRYEVQILDSFGLPAGDRDGGSLYGIRAPVVNMCFPPLSWQTYDIDFTAPRFDSEGNKLQNARITVRHNGIVIHKDCELPHSTGLGAPEGPDQRPLRLQDHESPVQFRNIWVLPRPGRDCEPPAHCTHPSASSFRQITPFRLAPGPCARTGTGFLSAWSMTP
ncbi:MAG: 3-keto-disaccharide hydrolase [Planctomycetaceae bacterium]